MIYWQNSQSSLQSQYLNRQIGLSVQMRHFKSCLQIHSKADQLSAPDFDLFKLLFEKLRCENFVIACCQLGFAFFGLHTHTHNSIGYRIFGGGGQS